MPKSRDQWNLPNPETIKDTDQILNIAAFDHLKQLVAFIPDELKSSEILAGVCCYCSEDASYDPSCAYGNLYSHFISFIERYISVNKELKNEIDLEKIDDLVVAIFCNPNQALEYIEVVIEPTVKRTHQTSNQIEHVITKQLTPQGNCLNTNNPTYEGSYKGRAAASLAGTVPYSEYKSIYNTNVPQILQYHFKEGSNKPIELRIGTQGQYHLGTDRVSPLFDYFLEIQKRRYPEKEITHVYFNNLRLDDACYEARWEKALAESLHKLEKNHSNVAVISIPADFKIKGHETTKNFKSKLIDAVKKNNEGFRISQAIREKVFKGESGYSAEFEQFVLDHLYEQTLSQLGLSTREDLSDKEQQAVFNFFSKYMLQDYLLEKLGPVTFNNSCKDGIDRSRISSLILNLMWSIHQGEPLSEQEFIKGLHSASTLVKGRGVNSHSQKLWAVIDVYLKANPEFIKSAKIPQWLVDWRDQNEPDIEKIKKNLLAQLESESQSKDLKATIDLFEQLMDWDNLDNPYRELARQQGWSYNAYGYTNSIYAAAESLKNSILEKSQKQISEMTIELKEKICKVSETHAHPYPFCRFGETSQASSPVYNQLRSEVDEHAKQQYHEMMSTVDMDIF
ncbi:hypothetical protein L3V82_09190 [Thiotrichales bacterium 19S3-7]|nr:hypothetical protein [Thiotrichales bacterium 19S3-7]MCF6802333.1 hypothetical protein [Thiotrichales bacterium 19S3-11]